MVLGESAHGGGDAQQFQESCREASKGKKTLPAAAPVISLLPAPSSLPVGTLNPLLQEHMHGDVAS